MKHLLAILLLTITMTLTGRAAVPADCTQAIIGIANDWDDSRVNLTLAEKQANGQWAPVYKAIPGRLGKNGLVWGLGLHRNPRRATIKKEGDGRSPAGVFDLGGLWVTTKKKVRHHRGIPLVQVDARDLWVSDISRPDLYNRWVRLPRPARTAWELNEQMRLNDYPHSIKLLICHNTQGTAGRPVPGAGSSIFFHIWRRDGASATMGCTSMHEQNLRAIIQRLDPTRRPVYILLPKEEYARYRRAWRLP